MFKQRFRKDEEGCKLTIVAVPAWCLLWWFVGAVHMFGCRILCSCARMLYSILCCEYHKCAPL